MNTLSIAAELRKRFKGRTLQFEFRGGKRNGLVLTHKCLTVRLLPNPHYRNYHTSSKQVVGIITSEGVVNGKREVDGFLLYPEWAYQWLGDVLMVANNTGHVLISERGLL